MICFSGLEFLWKVEPNSLVKILGTQERRHCKTPLNTKLNVTAQTVLFRVWKLWTLVVLWGKACDWVPKEEL